LQGLERAFVTLGGRIFEDTQVVAIDEGDPCRVISDRGVVAARDVIVAAHVPIVNRVLLHTKLAAYRSYVLGIDLGGDAGIGDGLYWDMADPYHYVRLNPGPGTTDYLIVGGADHKSGEADDGDVRFEAIEAWIRSLVPQLGKEVHRWSGQVLDTIDYCGFIGRNPGSGNAYVVTGDSGQGMTHGALAGILLKDLMLTGQSPWAAVYDPARKSPSGIMNYVRENVTAIKNFAEHLMPGEPRFRGRERERLGQQSFGWGGRCGFQIRQGYDRGHLVTFPGGQAVKASAAKEFMGKAELANPEEVLAGRKGVVARSSRTEQD